MKILIISSEPLNPNNTLSSTFELTQANLILNLGETAILAVSLNPSIIIQIKKLIKLTININKWSYLLFTKLINELLTSIFCILKIKKNVNLYYINNIPVIESRVDTLKHPNDFNKLNSIWNKFGLYGFNHYIKKFGKPDIIHAHGRFLHAGSLAMEIKIKFGIDYIYTEHSTFFRRGLVDPKCIPTMLEVIEKCTYYTAVSPALLNDVQRTLSIKIHKAFILPNALDSIFEDKIEIRSKDSPKFTFITIASLEPKKGIDLLIQAYNAEFKGLNDVELLICGAGPWENEYKKSVKDYSLQDNIKFLGQKSKKEIFDLLNNVEGFILPSRIETFGVVVIEALSRGVPVIATKCGGPEFIIDESNGIIVEPENYQQLGNAMRKLREGVYKFDPFEIHTNTIKKYGSRAFISSMQTLYGKTL